MVTTASSLLDERNHLVLNFIFVPESGNPLRAVGGLVGTPTTPVSAYTQTAVSQ